MATPNLYQENFRADLFVCNFFCIRSSGLSFPMIIQVDEVIFLVLG